MKVESTCGSLSREHWCSRAPGYPIDGDSIGSGSLETRDVCSPEVAEHCEVVSSLHLVGFLHLNDKVLIGQVIRSPVESEAIPACLSHGEIFQGRSLF